MSDDARLLELVVRWEELRDAGQPVDVEELCRDCPELLPSLRKRIGALGAVDSVLAGAVTDSHSPGDHAVPATGTEVPPAFPGYEVLRELGHGGMGVVYEARQISPQRQVALKVLAAGPHATASNRARFRSEAEAVARLQHPNLIQVFEVGEYDGRAYFSMEYMPGGTLEDRIGSRPQPARQAAELVEILAGAVHAAHERGVVHRDLKPANVLLTAPATAGQSSAVSGFGIPKVGDFGLAKLLDGPAGPTLTEHILGTPAYMAPEQATGQSKQVGPATDVYALGAILYRLLTGRPPFLGESALEIVRQVEESEPVPPRQLLPTVPADLETISLKCLHKQPGQRYASAAALAEDLHRFLAGEPILAKPVGWWGRLTKWSRRRPATAGLIAVSGLAVIVLLSAATWFTQRLAAEVQLTRAADQQLVAARDDLEAALAQQVAAALDADLRQLEMAPQSMAALLSNHQHFDGAELEGWLRVLVKKDKRVFGMGVALAPHQIVGGRDYDNYCLYIYKTSYGLSAKQLLPPSYPPPPYRERDWYKIPKLTGRAWWSEPYTGQRADDTPMLTYSVPFYLDDNFGGVVMADLSVEYFHELRDGLQRQYIGPGRSSFVITPAGTFLFHHNGRFEFPSISSSLKRVPAAPDFLEFIRTMRQQESGRGVAMDFESRRRATYFFARIPATGAYFVLVQPDPIAAQGTSTTASP